MICCLLALLAAFPGIAVFRAASAARTGCCGDGTFRRVWWPDRDVRIGMGLAGLVMAAVSTVVLTHMMIHGSIATLFAAGGFGDVDFTGQICSAAKLVFNAGSPR